VRAALRQAHANLRRGRLPAVLVGVTVLASATLLAVAFATLGAAGSAYERLHDRVDGAHLWLELDPAALPAAEAGRVVAGLDGVVAATDARASVSAALRVDGERQWLHLRDWPGEAPVSRAVVTDGRAPQLQEVDELALDRNLAAHLGVEVGQVIGLETPTGWQDVEVVGLTVNADMCPAPMCSPVQSFLAEGGLQRAGLSPSPYPGAERLAIGVRLADPERTQPILEAAQAVLPPGALITSIDHHQIAEFSDFAMRIQSVFLLAFGGVAAMAAGFLIANAISGAVRGQTRQIGLLKAVGFTRRQLAGTYLVQYLGLALLASVVGLGAGTLLARAVLADTTVRFAERGAPMPWWTMVLVPLLVVGVAAVFTLLPVLRATRVDVVSAVRTGGLTVRRRPARLVPLPAAGATAWVDLRAQPVRTILTAAGLGLAALTLVFASLTLSTLDTMRDDPASGLGVAADLTVDRPQALSDEQVQAVFASEPRIAAVRSGTYVPWTLQGDTESKWSPAVGGDIDAFPVSMIEGRGFARPGEAIVGYGLASDQDLRPGDVLPIVVGGHDIELQVTGVYREMGNLGMMFTTHADTIRAVDPTLQADGYELLLTEDADPAAVVAALAAASGGRLEVREATSLVGPVLDPLPAVMLALAVVLAVIAALGVFNTVWMGVRERLRELGLLKAVGMSGAQVIASVLLGVGLMAVIGYAIGLPAGIVLTGALLDSLGRALGFGPIALTADRLQLGVVLPVLVCVGVLGALIPARRAAGVAVADALRAD
jgi:putative ABC transport system permease protein